MITPRSTKSKLTAEERQRIRDESLAVILEHLASKPGKKTRIGPVSGKIIVETDPGTRRVMKRVRTRPMTAAELWAAIQKYFPAELHPAAVAGLLGMLKGAKREAPAKKPGIGEQVEALMHGLVPLDQHTARSIVAGRIWQAKRGKVVIRAGRADFAADDAAFTRIYERVALLHRQHVKRRGSYGRRPFTRSSEANGAHGQGAG